MGSRCGELQRTLHRRRDELERVIEGMVKDHILSFQVTSNGHGAPTTRYITAKKHIVTSEKGDATW